MKKKEKILSYPTADETWTSYIVFETDKWRQAMKNLRDTKSVKDKNNLESIIYSYREIVKNKGFNLD